MKISKKYLQQMIEEETKNLQEAFGSNSWSAKDIADMGDELYADIVPQNRQVKNAPDIRQIMAMAIQSHTNLINLDVIQDIIEQAGQQGLKLDIRDPEVWIAAVQGKFSNYGGPRAEQMKGAVADLYHTYANVPTPNLDRKFQNSAAPSQVAQRGSPIKDDHPADGMEPHNHRDVHQGGLESQITPLEEPIPSSSLGHGAQHAAEIGQTGGGAYIKTVLSTLSTKDLTDPRSAELAIKVLRHVIAQLEQISQS